jgi:hypothetical protein
MTTAPTKCFGKRCARHASCERWIACDGSDPDSPAIATCGDAHPLYVERAWAGYEARKAEFISANPGASAEQIEAACRAAAQREGL